MAAAQGEHLRAIARIDEAVAKLDRAQRDHATVVRISEMREILTGARAIARWS